MIEFNSKNIKTYYNTCKHYFLNQWREHRKRFISVVLLLIAVIGVIIYAALRNPTPETTKTNDSPSPLQVEAVKFGDTSVMQTTTGSVQDVNTVQLVAQSAGPVSVISVSEGDAVYHGQLILQQRSAYNAGNQQSVSRQIAQKNLKQAETTLQSTVESVSLRREQASLNEENSDEQRRLLEESENGVDRLIELSEDQVEYLEQQIETAPDDATRATLRGQLLGVQSTLNQARSQQRDINYRTDQDNPPAELSEVSRDLVFSSTEGELEVAKLQRDIAALNLKSARIAEAATRVTAPFSGTIQSLEVTEGQYVQPGTPVAVISGQEELQLSVLLSSNLAQQVDRGGTITLQDDGQTFSVPIQYVSQVPVQGSLHELTAILPNGTQALTDGESVAVDIPLLQMTPISSNYYVPLDAVFVTNRESFVFVVGEDGSVEQRTVETGTALGDVIDIRTGLVPGDIVILDRRVTAGMQVEYKLRQSAADVAELG